jgi:hypothetical protein
MQMSGPIQAGAGFDEIVVTIEELEDILAPTPSIPIPPPFR